MDRTAFPLALGILVFVLSYSCLGIGWTFSLPIALGMTIAMRIVRQSSQPSEIRNEARLQA